MKNGHSLNHLAEGDQTFNPTGNGVSEISSNLPFQLLFEQIGVGIACVNQAHQLIQVNTKFCELLGYAATELQLRPWQDFLYPEDYRVHWSAIRGQAARLPVHQPTSSSLELRFVCKDGSIRWTQATVSWIQAAAETDSFQTIVVQDISHRKQMEVDREYHRAELQAIFSAITELIIVTDAEGRYLEIAPANQKLLYRSAAELIGKTVHEVLPPAVADASITAIRQALQTRQTVNYEYSLEIAGREAWFSANVSPFSENSVVVVAHDITRHKQLDLALQVSEARLHRILNSINGSIASFRCISEGDYQTEYISAGSEQVFGFTAEEFMADKELWRSRVFPEDLPHLLLPEHVSQAMSTTTEYRFRHKDGRLRWLVSLTSTEWEETLNSWVLTAIDIDITDRKRTEAELQDKEAFLRSIYEGVGNCIFVVDVTETGNFQFVGLNPYHSELTGLSVEDVRGKTPEQLFPPHLAADLCQNYQRCVDQGSSIAYEELLPFQGCEHWWLTRLTPLWDESSRIYRIIGTSINITKRKLAEAALRNSQERLAFLLTSSPAVIYTKPESRHCMPFLSDNVEQLTGFTIAELLQTPHFWQQQIHPDDRTSFLQTAAALYQQACYSQEYRFRHKDGSYRWFRDEAKLMRDQNGRPIETIGYWIDITTRKIAELALQQLNSDLERRIEERTTALQQSQEIFRQFAENIQRVFWMKDMEGNLLYVSPSYEDIWGQSVQFLYQNPRSWIEAVYPEDRAQLASLKSRPSSWLQQEVEYRITQPNGKVRWICDRAFPVYNLQGEVYRIAGIADDVTVSREAEAKIRCSRDLFEAVFQESADAIFLVDPVTLLNLDCNQRAMQLFEASNKEQLLSVQGQTLHRYPFPEEALSKALAELDLYGVWSQEIEYRTLKGNYFWGNIATKRIQVGGQLMSLVRVTDISQRKFTEQLLQSQLSQKEILLKEIHHRVKNNLQVISAMLKLQARTTQDVAILDVLEDSRSRLRAIALIHEILYQSNNLEQLEFHRYIQHLASTILTSHSNSNQISLTYQLQPVLLNLETAIPCGLLLSELITNAIKHAFPDGRRGKIHLTLATQEENPDCSNPLTSPSLTPDLPDRSPKTTPRHYVLTVQDTGIGIPADFDFSNLKSLGLKIVDDLTLQLRGTLKLDRSQGTQFQLTFSELVYHRRL